MTSTPQETETPQERYTRILAGMDNRELILTHERISRQAAGMSIGHELWETTHEMIRFVAEELINRMERGA